LASPNGRDLVQVVRIEQPPERTKHDDVCVLLVVVVVAGNALRRSLEM